MKTAIYILIVLALYFVFFLIFRKIGDWFSKMNENLNDMSRLGQENKKQAELEAEKRKQQQQAAWQQRQKVNNTNTYKKNTNNTNRTSSDSKKEPIKEPKKEQIPECLTILGFTKIPEDKNDIKVRYRKLSKVYHPDMGGTQEEFQRLSMAWDEARKLYGLD